jgi:adenylate kinase
MSVTLVSGVTGVGLSSICQQARGQVGDGYTLVNFGDVMLEQARTHGIDVDRGDLAALSRTQTRRLQRRAAEYVADEAGDSEIILSTHLAVETQAGYVHGLPDGVLHDVSPSKFVLIEADPDIIRERRQESDRDIQAQSVRQIGFEQNLNRTAALEYARERDAPIQFIENQGSVDEAADSLTDLL